MMGAGFVRDETRWPGATYSLHSPNASLMKARAEIWEGKDQGGFTVLLVNPRWEKRLLSFLAATGVEKAIDGMDVEETRTTRMDGWIPWEVGEGTAPRAQD
jgi:hypothetical protein